MVIKSEVIYRAELSNGVILENDESRFKEFFRCVVCELRDSYGHSLYFESGSGTVYYGVLTTVYQGSRTVSSFCPLEELCTVHVCSMDRKTWVYTERNRKFIQKGGRK